MKYVMNGDLVTLSFCPSFTFMSIGLRWSELSLTTLNHISSRLIDFLISLIFCFALSSQGTILKETQITAK